MVKNRWSQTRHRCSASDAATSGESRPFRAGCAVGGKRLRGEHSQRFPVAGGICQRWAKRVAVQANSWASDPEAAQ